MTGSSKYYEPKFKAGDPIHRVTDTIYNRILDEERRVKGVIVDVYKHSYIVLWDHNIGKEKNDGKSMHSMFYIDSCCQLDVKQNRNQRIEKICGQE